jgi:beta-glucosidase
LVADSSGKPRYDFKGRLAFSWPADGTGKPINAANDPGVLFPYGFGLSYSEPSPWVAVGGDPGVPSSMFDGRILERGNAAGSFRLFLGDSSNANVPVTAQTGASVGGVVRTRGIDYRAQEDARELMWSGAGEGTARLSSGRGFDIASLDDAGALALELELRVDMAADDFFVALGCGEGCEGRLSIAKRLRRAQGDGWTSLRIPLKCFTDLGFDPKRSATGVAFISASRVQLALHSVRVVTARSPSACN